MRQILLLAGALALPSCATIVARGPDRVPIDSDPPGAHVVLNGRQVGVTPMAAVVDRDQGAEIRIELAGYQPLTVSVDKVFNGWFVGNIVFGGLIGMIVDIATGNVTKYSEKPVHVKLVPVGS
jgi:hypothetical protein